jgi:hypothetical protein
LQPSKNLNSIDGKNTAKAYWDLAEDTMFRTAIKFNGVDNKGLLSEMIDIISNEHDINMTSLKISADKNTFNGTIELMVPNIFSVSSILKKIRKIRYIKKPIEFQKYKMLNRNIAPEVKTGTELILRKPQKSVLSNGIPVYTFNLTEQDLIKIDFVFQAGSIYHQNPLIPEAANSLIESGTQLFTSAQIAEKFDFHGAYLDLLMGKHMAQLSLYTLNKYLEETLSLTKELLLNAVYPSHEIDIWLQNKYNSYLINRSKSDIISSEVFAETLFGEEHPYGRHIQDFHFKEFQKEDVSAFFKQYYNPASLTVFYRAK